MRRDVPRPIIVLFMLLVALGVTVATSSPWHLNIAIGFGDTSSSTSPTTTTSGSTNATAPTTPAVAAPVPTATSTTSTPSAIMAYLSSPERVQHYQAVAPKAAVLVAKGLEAGKFGKVERYDENKTTLKPGYVGWGGIETVAYPHTTYAWVYWNDGHIDYNHPVLAASVCYGQDLATYIQINLPDQTTQAYWDVAIGRPDGIREISNPNGINAGPFRSPTTVGGFKALDDQVLSQLANNMTYWFGPHWK